jgi:DNA-directed RNA polymerase specialized sigma24 family protein
MTHEAAADSEPEAPLAVLLENHRAFLRYLDRKAGDRAVAEDILQDAFAKLVRPRRMHIQEEHRDETNGTVCGTHDRAGGD